MFRQQWKVSSIPGGIQLSSRQHYADGLLTEEVVLEASPLTLQRAAATYATTYDYPAPRRRK